MTLFSNCTSCKEKMQKYFEEVCSFFKEKTYIGLTTLMAVIGYGYAATNISIGIDDIRGELEIGEGRQVIASGRFAQAIWPYLFGYKTEWIVNSFAIDIIALFILIFAAASCCALFRKASKNNIPTMAYTIFSCLMITYPLMNEIWEYTHINLCICIGILLSTIVIHIVYEQISEGWKTGKILGVIFLMTIVAAGYESVVSVYIFLVFAIIFLSVLFIPDKWSLKSIMKNGCIYAGILGGGIVGRAVLHKIILAIFNVPYDVNGNTGINWRSGEIGHQIRSLIVDWIDMYLLKSIIYFPLTEMVFWAIIYIGLLVWFVVKIKKGAIWIPGIGMLISLFILSLIQGSITFYRSCQVFAFFVGFTGMLLYCAIKNSNKRRLGNFVLFGLIWICLLQAINLNYWLSLNHLRSEEEERVICDIGKELRQDYDMSKPIVFAGTYCLSDKIMELASISKEDIRWKIYSYIYSKMHNVDFDSVYNNASRKIAHTNVNSVITWALNDQKDMQKLFAYYGIKVKILDDSEIIDKEKEKVIQGKVSAYPHKGYIEDNNEYIVVYIVN